VDLKAIEAIREVYINIFNIAYRHKHKYKVISFNILIKAIGL
jgi:hypothetical protein